MKEIEISEKDGIQIVHVNPELYSLDVIYSASYVFLDRAFMILDGDPKKEILVKIKSKNKDKNKEIGMEFFNELMNYSE